MKKFKRAAAILGVVILLAVFAMPMIFAFGNGENSQGMFRASVGMVILVPVVAYVFWMMYRVLNRREKEVSGTVKNVIFDVGTVLVGFDPDEFLKEFQFSEEAREAIRNHVFGTQEWEERDRGVYSEEYYVQQFVNKIPEYEKEVRALMKATPTMIYEQPYARTWAEYLKKQGYHLYILSNFSHYMRDEGRDQMSFLDYMDGVVFSCDVNQIKPEREIYETLLERYQLKPEECVFIDDRKENCDAAERLGIRTVYFTSFQQAVEELKKLGVE